MTTDPEKKSVSVSVSNGQESQQTLENIAKLDFSKNGLLV